MDMQLELSIILVQLKIVKRPLLIISLCVDWTYYQLHQE